MYSGALTWVQLLVDEHVVCGVVRPELISIIVWITKCGGGVLVGWVEEVEGGGVGGH